ncbi:hypothetical protein [Flavobacterium sp.]
MAKTHLLRLRCNHWFCRDCLPRHAPNR